MSIAIQEPALRHPYFILSLLSLIAALFFSWLAWNRKQNRKTAFYFIGFMIAQGVWAIATMAQMAFSSLSLQIISLQIWGTAGQMTGIFWLAFSLHYSDNEHHITSLPFGVGVFLSGVVVFAYWTNHIFNLIWSEAYIMDVVGIIMVETVDTPLVLIEFTMMFIYAIAGIVILFRNVSGGATKVSRRQSLLVAISGSILLGSGTIAILEAQPHAPIPITASSFAFSSAFIFWAMYGYQFLDILPVARRKVIAGMNQSVIVVDDNDDIIDVNESVVTLTGRKKDSLPGMCISDVFPDHPRLYDGLDFEDHTKIEVSIQLDREHHYQVSQSPLFSDEDTYAGRVLIFDDVTDEWEQRRELKRQNKRLEQFASTISHDLRNPLSIADGYLDIARKTGKDEHFDTIEGAHTRMDSMIEDILTLARQGKTVTEKNTTNLHESISDAGVFLDNESTTLNIDIDRNVQADDVRLKRVFANLFRNTIEHAGNNATIEVSELTDKCGFYIEDDGPGIPEDKRDDIFEYGVTHSEDGTGLGLAIVRNIIEAHGWEIKITDGEKLGGARFEVSNISFCDEEQIDPTTL